MKFIQGDLLEGNWDVACHVCNSCVNMGSGIAYFLRKKWPEVYEADVDYDDSTIPKNGNFSTALLDDGRKVFNLYAMAGIGSSGHPMDRNLRYDEFYDALYKMCYTLFYNDSADTDIKIALPYLIGCVRAGGSWTIVEAILKDIEAIFNIEFQVYVLEGLELDASSSVVIPK